jgi:hypothetical protein
MHTSVAVAVEYDGLEVKIEGLTCEYIPFDGCNLVLGEHHEE